MCARMNLQEDNVRVWDFHNRKKVQVFVLVYCSTPVKLKQLNELSTTLEQERLVDKQFVSIPL